MASPQLSRLRSPFAEALARARVIAIEVATQKGLPGPPFDDWEDTFVRTQRIADDRAGGRAEPLAGDATLAQLSDELLSFLGGSPPPDLFSRVDTGMRRLRHFNVLHIKLAVIFTLMMEFAALAVVGTGPTN